MRRTGETSSLASSHLGDSVDVIAGSSSCPLPCTEPPPGRGREAQGMSMSPQAGIRLLPHKMQTLENVGTQKPQ